MDPQIRSELKRIGRRMEFSDIKKGEVYHIPPILELKRKTILVEDGYEHYLKCLVEEEGKDYTYTEWIYDYELQAHFIVPFKRAKTGAKSKKDIKNVDDLPF